MLIPLCKKILIVAWVSLFIPYGIAQSTPQSTGSKSTLTLIVRDSMTGYAISGAVVKGMRVDGSIAHTLPVLGVSNQIGYVSVSGPGGDYVLETAALGYGSMRSHVRASSGSIHKLGLNLDPEAKPVELRDEIMLPKLKPGYCLVQGFVVNETTAAPFARAVIRLKLHNMETVSDERGYYSLEVPVAEPSNSMEAPAVETVIASAPGYRTAIAENILLPFAQSSGANFELAKGEGTTDSDYTHAPQQPAEMQELPSENPPENPPRPNYIYKWLVQQGPMR